MKNDFYIPHRTGTHSHRPATTSDDQMNIRPRQLNLAKETDFSKLCRGACEMSPKQRQRMASQSMGYSVLRPAKLWFFLIVFLPMGLVGEFAVWWIVLLVYSVRGNKKSNLKYFELSMIRHNLA